MTPEEQQRALNEKVQLIMTRGELVNIIAFMRNTNLGKMAEDSDTVASMYVHLRQLLESAQPYSEEVTPEAPSATGDATTPDASVPANVTPISSPPGTPAQ